jgi:hypothetical protein
MVHKLGAGRVASQFKNVYSAQNMCKVISACGGVKFVTQIFRCTITLVVLMATITSAQELPKMPYITAGQVDISQSLNELVVRQTSESGIINWDSFNVSKGAGVIFEQPSAKAITLNNILSAAPSVIDGQLTAPGACFSQAQAE